MLGRTGYVQRHAAQTRELLRQVVLLATGEVEREEAQVLGGCLLPVALLGLAGEVFLGRVVRFAVVCTVMS